MSSTAFELILPPAELKFTYAFKQFLASGIAPRQEGKMKFRLLMAAVVLVGMVGSAGAEEMLIAPDTDGCQLYAPYVWVTIPGGDKWTVTVDLSRCPIGDLGWFRFYGHITQGHKFDALRVGDRIVLEAKVRSSNAVYTFNPTARRTQIMIQMPVDEQTFVELTATNTSKKAKKVRITWLSMRY